MQCAEMLAQVQPRLEQHFIETGAADRIGDQDRTRAQAATELLSGSDMIRRRIDMHRAFAIAMQVQHDIGIVRQPHQTGAHCVKRRAAFCAVQQLPHAGAYGAHIVLRIVAQGIGQ